MVSKYSWLSVEALVKTASLEDAYTRYYSDIPREIFNELVGADPTALKDATGWPRKMGRFGTWILRNYTQGLLKFEDLYKVTRDLTSFVALTPSLKGKESTDINRFKTPQDLASFVRERVAAPKEGVVSEDPDILFTDTYFLETKQARKKYEDASCIIVEPFTLSASRFYGEGSDWCTLFPDRFRYYSNQGPLYIIIFREDPWENRFQFHFESEQFMDLTDNEIELDLFFEKNPNLEKFFRQELGPRLPDWYGTDFKFEVRSLKELITTGARLNWDFFNEVFDDYVSGYDHSFSECSEILAYSLSKDNEKLLLEIISSLLGIPLEDLEGESPIELLKEDDTDTLEPVRGAILNAYDSAFDSAQQAASLKAIRSLLTDHYGIDFSSWRPGDAVTISKKVTEQTPWWDALNTDSSSIFENLQKIRPEELSDAVDRATDFVEVDDSYLNSEINYQLQELKSELPSEPHTPDLPGMEAQ